MIARKRLPEHLQAAHDGFVAVIEEVEPAKAGLADVVPGTRLSGRPLRDAIGEYRMRLGRAQGLMPAWRYLELEAEWEACDRGLREALHRADLVLAVADDPRGFEGLLGTVERLMDPLDPFAAAAERFRRLRRRARA